MMLVAGLLLSMVAIANACPPGLGTDATLVRNPTFTFSFYPPAAWTYYSGPPPTGVTEAEATVWPGQAITYAEAQRKMKNDIDTAIQRALTNLGVSSNSAQWSMSGYYPLACLIRENNGTPGWRAVGTCVPQIGAVTTLRTTVDTDQGNDLVQRGSLRVSTSLLVTRSQWKYMAAEVYNQLTIYSKVYFTSPIVLN